MDRKKELKDWYKEYRPPMGVILFRCNPTQKSYLEADKDVQGTINGLTFQLNTGFCVNKNLTADWKKYGEENFTVEVVEYLEYDKDETKTDYTEDLEILLHHWMEQLPESEKIKP